MRRSDRHRGNDPPIVEIRHLAPAWTALDVHVRPVRWPRFVRCIREPFPAWRNLRVGAADGGQQVRLGIAARMHNPDRATRRHRIHNTARAEVGGPNGLACVRSHKDFLGLFSGELLLIEAWRFWSSGCEHQRRILRGELAERARDDPRACSKRPEVSRNLAGTGPTLRKNSALWHPSKSGKRMLSSRLGRSVHGQTAIGRVAVTDRSWMTP
jgi:hypothetical protein